LDARKGARVWLGTFETAKYYIVYKSIFPAKQGEEKN